MRVTANFIVVCGFAGCPWSMQIDPAAGADTMAVHEAYLEHLDEHDEAECETAADHWVGVAQALVECSSCHAQPGQPHTEYCTLPQWAAHDAEVARCLAEDRIPAAPPGGGFYNGQLYPGPGQCPEIRNGVQCNRLEGHGVTDGLNHYFPAGGLYAGDTPEQIAAEQARVDQFMRGE